MILKEQAISSKSNTIKINEEKEKTIHQLGHEVQTEEKTMLRVSEIHQMKA